MNNAIKYVKILESTGISREQAEAHVQVLAEFLEGDLVTKQDLLNSENSLKFWIDAVDITKKRIEYQVTDPLTPNIINCIQVHRLLGIIACA